jgi:hypothetical protein
LALYLDSLEPNTAENPCPAAYTGDDTAEEIYAALAVGGRYVSLDLSGSGVTGFANSTNLGRDLVVELILPDTLTIIPAGSSSTATFSGFTNLKTVRGSGVKVIDQHAFMNCTALESITFDEATSIGYGAFQGCTGFSGVSLPKATGINQIAFQGCFNLTTVTLPLVTTINPFAFDGCTRLTTVTLPLAAFISSSAFSGCNALTEVTLPLATTLVIPRSTGVSGLPR